MRDEVVTCEVSSSSTCVSRRVVSEVVEECVGSAPSSLLERCVSAVGFQRWCKCYFLGLESGFQATISYTDCVDN